VKRFNFRLDKVLDLRKMSEEQAQRRMSDAQRARTLQEQTKSAAEVALREQEGSFRGEIQSGLNAGEALINSRFHQKLRSNVAVEAARLVHAEEIVSDRRLELAEAARQKKMLEVLRDKRMEEHTLETLRIEQGVLDDEAGQRLARTREIYG